EQNLRISLEDIKRHQRTGEPLIFLDTRLNRSYYSSEFQIQGAIRLLPDKVAFEAQRLALPHHAWLAAYCT
ncbi:MAG TPA: hypothetical protein VFN35_10310, partial [Ktedonobacteraceae bacterium]|nr:hypothetical protein [Ktedonobacteraceae bacterium]